MLFDDEGFNILATVCTSARREFDEARLRVPNAGDSRS